MSMDNIYLQGSEQVQSAGYIMNQASERMLQAANLINESVYLLERVLETDRQERERILNEHG